MKYIVISAIVIIGAVIFFLANNKIYYNSETVFPIENPEPYYTSPSSEVPLASPSLTQGISIQENMDNEIEKEFVVTANNFMFTPSVMRVNKGDNVKIIFKNEGGMHDFIIDELNIATKRVTEGVMEIVEFKASIAGSFEYYCSVGNHRVQGMKGMFIVE